ncbi:FMNH2-dependent monooxygenase [Celeribacter indicus]|uniref:FMNH2-dependent monooxygenase n=1 Tax=Celeribacter indicus TaxID=1208324 RepID=A0A0B5E0L2_9RHOB|nr:FMNH2-dependent monooxygenase [Celeribacter indicus]
MPGRAWLAGEGREQSVRDALAELRSTSADRDRRSTSDREAVNRLKRLGFGALRFPDTDGTPALDLPEAMSVVMDVAAADSSIAHAFRSHFGFLEGLLLTPASEARSTWLQRIAAGQTCGSAVTERATARPMEIESTLRPDGDGYTIDTEKYYTTGTLYADWLFLMARSEDRSLQLVTIPTLREGVELLDDFDGIGQRASASGGVRFTGVHIRKSEVEPLEDLPEVNRYRSSLQQLYLAALLAGIASAALEDARSFVLKRARSAAHGHADQPRNDLFVQQIIGRIAARATIARAGVLSAAAKLDRTFEALRRGDSLGDLLVEGAVEVAKIHSIVAELVVTSGDLVLETGGGSAVSRSTALDRHWRNARTIAAHSPMYYKSQVVGDAILNDTPPPTNGYF